MNINNLAQKVEDDAFITEVSKKYFTHYDRNGDNLLEKKELLTVMTDIAQTFFGCTPEKGAIDFQFSKLDTDKNNRIDFAEFKAFIKDYLKMMVDF